MESSNVAEAPAEVETEDETPPPITPLIMLEPVDDAAVCGPDGMCL